MRRRRSHTDKDVKGDGMEIQMDFPDFFGTPIFAFSNNHRSNLLALINVEVCEVLKQTTLQ